MEKCGRGESETPSPRRQRVSPGTSVGELAGRELVESLGVTGAGRELLEAVLPLTTRERFFG